METIDKKDLKVKRSQLPKAGNGLFTKVFIPKGTLIVEYTGRINTWKAVKELPDNGYLFFVNRNHVIDAFPHKKALARFANDAKGLARVKGLVNNSEYVTKGLKVYIKSKRDLQPGEEIFVGYGDEYWQTVKDNIKNGF